MNNTELEVELTRFVAMVEDGLSAAVEEARQYEPDEIITSVSEDLLFMFTKYLKDAKDAYLKMGELH